VKQLPCP